MLTRLLVVLALAVTLGASPQTPMVDAATRTLSVSLHTHAGIGGNGTVMFVPVGSETGLGPEFPLVDGASAASSLPLGDYLVWVSTTNLDLQERYYDGSVGGAFSRLDAKTFHWAGGSEHLSFTVADLALGLHGRVLSGDGTPMANWRVTRTIVPSGIPRSVFTDADGYYDFGPVQSGTLGLGPDNNGDEIWAGLIDIAEFEDRALDLVMYRRPTVTGVLTDRDSGEPIVSAEVALFAVGSAHSSDSVTTDWEGRFRLSPYLGGAFVLRYVDCVGAPCRETWSGGVSSRDQATPVQLPVNTNVVRDEAIANPDPLEVTHSLGGVVSEEGTGITLPGILVRATETSSGAELTTQTDWQGRWALDAPEGRWRLHFEPYDVWLAKFFAPSWAPEYYPDAWGSADAEVVTVTPGGVHDGLDVALFKDRELTILSRLDDPFVGNGCFDPSYTVYDLDGNIAYRPDFLFFNAGRMDVSLRPGSWKILVESRCVDNGKVLEQVPQWYTGEDQGAADFENAAVVTVPERQRVRGTLRIPTTFRALEATSIAGAAEVGETLTGTPVTSWNFNTGTTVSYGWWRGRTKLGSGSTYVVQPSDAGRRVTFQAVGANGTLRAHTRARTGKVPTLPATVRVLSVTNPAPRTFTIRAKATSRYGLPDGVRVWVHYKFLGNGYTRTLRKVESADGTFTFTAKVERTGRFKFQTMMSSTMHGYHESAWYRQRIR